MTNDAEAPPTLPPPEEPAGPEAPPRTEAEERALADETRQRLEGHIERAEVAEARELLDELPPRETAWALSHLDDEAEDRLFASLSPEDAAHLVERISDAMAADVMERLEPAAAAAILHELPSDEQADLLAEMEADEAREILAAMDPQEAEQALRLAAYPAEVAGALMASEFILLHAGQTCGEVIAELRRRAEELQDYAVQYAYLADEHGVLAGVVRPRDLLFAPDRSPVSAIMIPEPKAVGDDARLNELGAFFDRHDLLGVPVVDGGGRMIGIVHRTAVEEALGERAESDYLKSQGIVGGEEFRSMPLRQRSLRRLSWLTVNILLNVVAASVIAVYEDTLSAAIALAVFIPILSDMSGCSGSQAVAVSIRELSLGLIKPFEMTYVWLAELKVGLVNGLVLGTLLSFVAWAWKGNPWLGLVVGLAMALNTLVAVSVGGVVPLLLKRLGKDPALAAGPILTTVTDICGFFLVLSLATQVLPRLAGV